MENKQNLHTHSSFCDGKDAPREMIEAAIKKGFDSLGFSGHAYMFYSKDYSMTEEGTEEYKKCVKELKKEYKDKIELFLGLEFDMYSTTPLEDYDYIIGSCHYLKIGDEYVGIDRSEVIHKEIINKYFGGIGIELAREYYRQFSKITDYCKCDIIGHFDLIAKNIERADYFDVNSKEYKAAYLNCLDAFRGKIPFFEVNTGGMVRGYRKTPYPLFDILKSMKEMGFAPVISSDCHNSDYLDFAFEDVRELLTSAGFKERFILTENGFKAVKI